MEDKRKEAEKSLDDFQNKVREKMLQLVNDRQFWQTRATKLSKKFKACLDCGSQVDYDPNKPICKNCQVNYGK